MYRLLNKYDQKLADGGLRSAHQSTRVDSGRWQLAANIEHI